MSSPGQIPQWLQRYIDLTQCREFLAAVSDAWEPDGENLSPFAMLFLEIEYAARLFELETISPEGAQILKTSIDQRFQHYMFAMTLALNEAKGTPSEKVLATAYAAVKQMQIEDGRTGGVKRGKQQHEEMGQRLRMLDDIYRYLSDDEKQGLTTTQWLEEWKRLYPERNFGKPPSRPTMNKYLDTRGYPRLKR